MTTAWCDGNQVMAWLGGADQTGLSMEAVDRYAEMASDLLFQLSGRQYEGADQTRTVRQRADMRGYVLLSAWWPVNQVNAVRVYWRDQRADAQTLDPADWHWSGGVRLSVGSQYARWSVEADIVFGQDPPNTGVLAAQALAAEIARNDPEYSGKDISRLPGNVTSISRQGVTQSFDTMLKYLEQGQSGIYEVDLFLNTQNPSKTRSRPRVRRMTG